jgi:hypothetical protein
MKTKILVILAIIIAAAATTTGWDFTTAYSLRITTLHS